VTYTRTVGTYAARGGGTVTVARAWFVGGTQVAADVATYTPVSGDIGAVLFFREIATEAGGLFPGSVTRVATAGTVQAATAARKVVGLMGQGDLQRIIGPKVDFQGLPQPVIADENAMKIYARIDPPDSAIIVTPVTNANISAQKVNPAMAAITNMISYAVPGARIALVDLTAPGASRSHLMDDTAPNTPDRWQSSDYRAMLQAVVDGGDGELDVLYDAFLSSDFGTTDFWAENWSPFYHRQRSNGTAHTLGTVNPDATSFTTNKVDFCLWDANVASDQKGQGVYRRSKTKLLFQPLSHTFDPIQKYLDFVRSTTPSTYAFPDFAKADFAHIHDGHPLQGDVDGVIAKANSVAIACMEAAGLTIKNPRRTGLEVAPDGSFADLLFDLPNGGTLTTLRILEGRPDPATLHPAYQPVHRIQIKRLGDAGYGQPVMRLSETSIPAKWRGTVAITDTGTGIPPNRTGRVRVTPEVPFIQGDQIGYQIESPTTDPSPAALELLTDKLFINSLIEHVPALRDASALYPFRGIPFDQDLTYSSVSLSADPTVFFTLAGTGPVFAQPNALAANTTKIEHEILMFVPSTAVFSGTKFLFSQASTAFDIAIFDGTVTIRLAENSAGGSVVPDTSTLSLSYPKNSWFTLKYAIDHAAQLFTASINSNAPITEAFSASGTGISQTRSIAYFGYTNNTNHPPAGIRVAYVQTHLTSGGVRSLLKRIEGNAATVNADVWKLATSANAT
jgi:hypothetical protein